MEFKYIKQVLDFMDIEYRSVTGCRLYIPCIKTYIRYCYYDNYYALYKVGLYKIFKGENAEKEVMNEIMNILNR